MSLAAAISLTRVSERTFWRRFSDGSAVRVTRNGKSMVSVDSIRDKLCIPFAPEDFDLIESADSGSPQAQTELALIFLEHDDPAGAVYWLGLAAKQDFADAMQLLGRCHIDGKGVAGDDNLGLIWIAKAARLGHPIAAAQMQALTRKPTGAA